MSVSDRISNLEDGVRDSYAYVREHVDEQVRAVFDAIEADHLELLRNVIRGEAQVNEIASDYARLEEMYSRVRSHAAFMEAKLREQIREAIGE